MYIYVFGCLLHSSRMYIRHWLLRAYLNSISNCNTRMYMYIRGCSWKTFVVTEMTIEGCTYMPLTFKGLIYYFHMKKNVLADFQVCMSVPLRQMLCRLVFMYYSKTWYYHLTALHVAISNLIKKWVNSHNQIALEHVKHVSLFGYSQVSYLLKIQINCFQLNYLEMLFTQLNPPFILIKPS